MEDFVTCDENVVEYGEGSSSVDGAGGYAAATTVIGKRGRSATTIQTAGGISQGTQAIPPVQMAGGGAQDTQTMTTPTAPRSTGAANKHFGDGLGWQLRLGLWSSETIFICCKS